MQSVRRTTHRAWMVLTFYAVVAVPAFALKKIKLDFELPGSLSQLRPYVEVYEAYVAGELNEKCEV